MRKTTDLNIENSFGSAADTRGSLTIPETDAKKQGDKLSLLIKATPGTPKREGRIEDRDPYARSSVTLYLTNRNLQGIIALVKEQLVKNGWKEEEITDKEIRKYRSALIDQILGDYLNGN